MSRLTLDGTAELVSRDEHVGLERGQRKTFSLSSLRREGLAIKPGCDPYSYSAESPDHRFKELPSYALVPGFNSAMYESNIRYVHTRSNHITVLMEKVL